MKTIVKLTRHCNIRQGYMSVRAGGGSKPWFPRSPRRHTGVLGTTEGAVSEVRGVAPPPGVSPCTLACHGHRPRGVTDCTTQSPT